MTINKINGVENKPAEKTIPICAQTISVRAPKNCGVVFTPNLMVSSSRILPMESQSADFKRYRNH